MTDQRYVVLGLAHVRSTWFTEVARWATSGSLPVEFVKCISLEELRARLAGGRPFSAALLDGRLPVVDRDLMATLADHGIASIVVPSGDGGPDWAALGARAVLPAPLERAALLDALAGQANMIGNLDTGLSAASTIPTKTPWRGRLVAVMSCSSGGASTVAAAIAQSLADDPRNGTGVILADLARRPHQGILHDARDVVPGLQELVEAHRSGRPAPEQVRRLTFEVPSRGYRLLIGLRRTADWVTMRSRALDAALDGLRSASRAVVVDIDADLEGEATTGSLDIEDRNLLTRTAVTGADVVVVVATPNATAIHGLVVQIEQLRAFGVPGDRILVVINRAGRSARARSALTRSIADLTGAAEASDPHIGPVFIPERRNIDSLLMDLARLPKSVTDPCGTAVATMLDRLGTRIEAETPVAITPGSLGTWGDDHEAIS